jgi:hypothetical protein
MNKTKITEDLDSLTYAMSDEEIVSLNHNIMESIMVKNNIKDISKVSFEKKMEIIEFMSTVPRARKLIDSLVKIGEGTREELEAENRERYAKQAWKQYLQ